MIGCTEVDCENDAHWVGGAHLVTAKTGPQDSHHEATGRDQEAISGQTGQTGQARNIVIQDTEFGSDIYCRDCGVQIINMIALLNHICLPVNTVQSDPGQ